MNRDNQTYHGGNAYAPRPLTSEERLEFEERVASMGFDLGMETETPPVCFTVRARGPEIAAAAAAARDAAEETGLVSRNAIYTILLKRVPKEEEEEEEEEATQAPDCRWRSTKFFSSGNWP